MSAGRPGMAEKSRFRILVVFLMVSLSLIKGSRTGFYLEWRPFVIIPVCAGYAVLGVLFLHNSRVSISSPARVCWYGILVMVMVETERVGG